MLSFRAVLSGVAVAATLVAGSMLVSAPARADDDGFKTKAAGQFVVRLRGLAVLADGGDAIKTAGGVDTTLRTRVGNDYVPEVDLSYFITDNIAVEAIAGTTKHSVKTQTGIDAGTVRLLPPTITAQYHFFTKERFSPYLGAGLNYTIFFNEEGGVPGVQPMKFSNGFGPALQAGLDVALTGNWSLNVDVKKIWLSSDVKLAGGALKTTANVDPLLVGFGVGYRF